MALFWIRTLSDSCYQTILASLELTSKSIHTFTELIPNISKHLFFIFYGHLNRQKILKEKSYLGLGGVYTMENDDTNTDYQKFVRLGDQKW